MKQTEITNDPSGKKMKVVREFHAPVDEVWKAWTTREILDKWWAPKPWRAETKNMNFKPGGSWLYCMVGPAGERSWARADFETVNPEKGFTGTDAFCDEQGKINEDFPVTHWKVDFLPAGQNTRVEVELTFKSEADLNKIVELGFKEGFTAAHANLDALLEKVES